MNSTAHVYCPLPVIKTSYIIFIEGGFSTNLGSLINQSFL